MARKSTDFIIIHCAATPPNQDTDISDVDRWHREQGWRMVGYHYFIKRDGTLQVGRPLMDGGAHAGSAYNNRSVGVCMAGGICGGETCTHEHETFTSGQKGKPENNYTPAQWATLKEIVTELHGKFPQAKVIGHNDVAAKACPCFDAKAWWAENQPA